MKNALVAAWKSIPTLGKIFLACFLIYFLGKIAKH